MEPLCYLHLNVVKRDLTAGSRESCRNRSLTPRIHKPCCLLTELRAISTARLNASPRLHLRPIDVVVCDGPLVRSYLGVGFVLRCFQHLSSPDAATRRCSWRYNRHTGGLSSTVLSY